MKKNILTLFIISITLIGVVSLSSCKRGSNPEPTVIGPAGFRIAISGTASPSTMYIPESEPQVSATITVRAVNNDGTAASGYDVIFEEGLLGYFEGYKNSITKTLDGNGTTSIIFFIPAAANIKNTQVTNIKVTLVDDGRLDTGILSQIFDYIPVEVVPYIQQGIVLSGHVLTPAGNGVADVTITLAGADNNLNTATVTRSSGSYEFLVPSGWYGSISADAAGYSTSPTNYTWTVASPATYDRDDLDFIASFEGGNNLATDITEWNNIPIQGGTQLVNVFNGTGDATITYTVAPTTGWITVNSSSGSTPGSFIITVSENTDSGERTGEVVVTASSGESSSVTIAVNQMGNDVGEGARLAVDLTTINFENTASSETVNVYNSTTSDSINYIITRSANWIGISSNSGSTNDNFTVSALANTEGARSGTITLTPTSTGANNIVTITVNQDAGASIITDISVFNTGQAGGDTQQVTVTNPTTTDILTWTVDSDETWIGLSPTSGTTESGTFTITIQAANPNAASRQGIITVTASNGATAVILVVQAGTG